MAHRRSVPASTALHSMSVSTAAKPPGKLIVICGLPGSGKTTLARQLAGEVGAVRLCPDEWLSDLEIDLWDEDVRSRVETLQWKLAKDILRLGTSVIIEWGVWAREERDRLREGARELGAAVELHYLDVPLDELWRRIKARNETGDPSAATIEREHLEQWSEQFFQPPTEEERSLFD